MVHNSIMIIVPPFGRFHVPPFTPTYILAKFLVLILSPLVVNEFTVHGSFSFAEEVANFASC